MRNYKRENLRKVSFDIGHFCISGYLLDICMDQGETYFILENEEGYIKFYNVDIEKQNVKFIERKENI